MIFAGGGSHASYFKPGEYILQIELPITKSLRRVGAAMSRFWSGTLREGTAGRGSLSVFTVPFVDYARGDGLSIGPGQAKEWSPINLDPVPDWVTRYRGLWGLSREISWGARMLPRVPCSTATARYARPGTTPSGRRPRQGRPAQRVQPLLERHRAELVEANVHSPSRSRRRRGARVQNEELAALAGNPYVEREYDASPPGSRSSGPTSESSTAPCGEHREPGGDRPQIERLRDGATDDPKAHIRHANEPITSREARFGRAAEVWAGISIGLVLVALVAVVLLAPAEFLPTAAFLIGLTLFIDALFRGVAEQFVNTLAVVLAVATAAILLWTFWQLILLGLLLAAGIYLTWENLRTVGE